MKCRIFADYLQGAKSVLRNFNGSIIKALQYLFPELDLDASKFSFFSCMCPLLPTSCVNSTLLDNYWNNTANRRQVFEKFASDNGFDPLVAQNWIPFRSEKVHVQILFFNSLTFQQNLKKVVNHYYNSDLGSALTHLFPEMTLDSPKLNWKSV